MSSIPDVNFNRFLREDLDLNRYVLTTSLEPIERSKYNPYKLSNEFDKVTICNKIEQKFQAHTNAFTLSEQQHALTNLKALHAEFSKSIQEPEAIECSTKLAKIISKLMKTDVVKLEKRAISTPIDMKCLRTEKEKERQPISEPFHFRKPKQPYQTLLPQEDDSPIEISPPLRRSSSSYSMSPFHEENSSPKKTLKPLTGKLLTIPVIEGLKTLRKHENVLEQENYPVKTTPLLFSTEPQTPPALEDFYLKLKEAEIQINLVLLQQKEQRPLTQRLESACTEEKWANQTFVPQQQSTERSIETPRDPSKMRSRRTTSPSPVRDKSVLIRGGRRDEANPPTSPRMPTERTRKYQIT